MKVAFATLLVGFLLIGCSSDGGGDTEAVKPSTTKAAPAGAAGDAPRPAGGGPAAAPAPNTVQDKGELNGGMAVPH